MIILYNPKTAKPGYQRLPNSLMQLASLLENRYPYEIIDGNLYQDEDMVIEISTRIKRYKIRYLGVTIMPGPQLQRSVPQIKRLKEIHLDLTIIVGGYFPSIHWEICARHPSIDYVVIGYGENTLWELLEALEDGRDPTSIRGLAFEREGRVIRTPDQEPSNPDDLPWYPYHRVDVEKYITKTHLGQRTFCHNSSFGCPFQCDFCAVGVLSKGCWKAESAGRLGELTQYMVDKWQIDALEFHDSNFFVSEERVAEYCQELINRNVEISWWGEARIDTMLDFSAETWKLMRRSGLKMVFLGAESGDDQTLKRMNKGGSMSVCKTLEFAEQAKKYDIIPEYSFILGNPPDPHEDILRNIEIIRKVKAVNPNVEIVLYCYDPVPKKGAMWQEAQNSGFELPGSLDEWINPSWEKVHSRRSADLSWLSEKDIRLIRDFETVLNAYSPTSTDKRVHGCLQRMLLFLFSAGRYRFQIYKWPYELRLLQNLIYYQRPEVSGF